MDAVQSSTKDVGPNAKVLEGLGQHSNEFLTFTLGDEEYGVEILKVQEIRGYEKPTEIPSAPSFLKGVVNLRGVIVPIIDMRVKFGLPNADYSPLTVVIILNVANRVVGIVVDSVSDVIALPPEKILPTPEFSQVVATEFLIGLGAVEERMLILMDIERLMGSADMALVTATTT